MTIFVRDAATAPHVLDRWADGFGWVAHPDESGRRTSHAVRSDDGVRLIDPIDARGVSDQIERLGDVVGVVVLSNWHARDAGEMARRYGVPVHVPRWMTRIQDRIDAPIDDFEAELDGSGFRVIRFDLSPGWTEAILYRESDGTLYVPDSLGTAPHYLVGDERIGLELVRRPFPPRDLLGGLEPERILVGHGEGVFEDASAALTDALEGGRRRFPRALLSHGATTVRALASAMLE